MKRRSRLISITLITTPLVLLQQPRLASASEVSVGIFPVVTRLSGVPGDTLEAPIHVVNNGKDSLILTPLVQSFRPSSQENGTVEYAQSTSPVLRNIRIEETGNPINELELAPGEEKIVTLRLNIPQKALSEDQYLSLIMMSKPSVVTSVTPDKTVSAYSSISRGIASHILIAISPKTEHHLSVTEFSSPSFSQISPVSFVLRTANQNNTLSQVHGKIEIKNVIGNTIEEVIIPKTLILSHSARSLTSQPRNENNKPISTDQKTTQVNQSVTPQTIKQTTPLLPGIYKATVSVVSDTQLNPITSTIYFSVAPVQLVLGIGVLLVFLYLLKKRILAKTR